MKIFNSVQVSCALLLLLFTVSFSGLAITPSEDNPAACTGNWHIEFKTNSSTEEKSGRRGVWIPGVIYLDRRLATCAKYVILTPPQRGALLLRGARSQHRYELKNSARQTLTVIGKNNYYISVLGKQKLDLWLYIPGGKDFAPGRYQGTLDGVLNSNTANEISKRTYTFNYKVEPYVRAKIATLAGSWNQSSGTSVRLHLGDLTTKNSRDLPIYIESNGLVSMTVTSLNKGSLVSVTNKQNKVPYQLYFRGKRIDLMSQTAFRLNNRQSSQQKMIMSFQNTAKPFARAGQYEDIVTINLNAR